MEHEDGWGELADEEDGVEGMGLDMAMQVSVGACAGAVGGGMVARSERGGVEMTDDERAGDCGTVVIVETNDKRKMKDEVGEGQREGKNGNFG